MKKNKKIALIICILLVICSFVGVLIYYNVTAKQYKEQQYLQIDGYHNAKMNSIKKGRITLYLETSLSLSKQKEMQFFDVLEQDYQTLKSALNLKSDVKVAIISDEYILSSNNGFLYHDGIVLCNSGAFENGKYKTALITDKKIYKILANTKYNGKIRHGDTVYDNIYPKIIDDVLWQKVQDIHTENKHAPGRKKEIFNFILSGKLYCGDCHRPMVGESGTSKLGRVYYYYSCLAKRRKQHPCKLKSVDKQWLEDIVINSTWSLLADEGIVRYIAETLCKMHEEETKRNTVIKSLEAQRQNALKASRNLIAAIEQGIVTEQTKIRLKELEAQIAGLDFDIEQEKQRTYTFLSPDKIESYLNSVICGDIQEMPVRKLIVKTCVREVILDNDSVTITYNFTENYTKYKISKETIEEIKRQSLKKTAYNKNRCSNKLPSLPPSSKPCFRAGFFLAFCRDFRALTN